MQWVEQRLKLNKPKLSKFWKMNLVNKMFNQTVEKTKKEMTENPAENLQDFLFFKIKHLNREKGGKIDEIIQ